eukprot:406208_1
MGNKQGKILVETPDPTCEPTNYSSKSRIKSNYIIELVTFGYIKEIFEELHRDKSYNSIIKLSIPTNIYHLCLYMYGLSKNRYIFQIENLSSSTCILSYKNRIYSKTIQCILTNKELLTNSAYKNCKSLYINNIKLSQNHHYCDIIVLCGAQSGYNTNYKNNYYASMITISDYNTNYENYNISANCSVLTWYPYWEPNKCSNITYDKQYGIIIAIYNTRNKNHIIYHLRLSHEYPEWKRLLILKYKIHKFDEHIFIQIVYKDNRKYLFVSDGKKISKLYSFVSGNWIVIKSNNNNIHGLSKICYDDQKNNRIYFIDISYCCYIDINTYKWERIPAPGFWSTKEDIVCIKDYIDRQDLMIIGRNYYFTYNVHNNKWAHRNTLDRHTKHENHESYRLV